MKIIFGVWERYVLEKYWERLIFAITQEVSASSSTPLFERDKLDFRRKWYLKKKKRDNIYANIQKLFQFPTEIIMEVISDWKKTKKNTKLQIFYMVKMDSVITFLDNFNP